MEKSILTPKEIAQSSISVAENKANMVWWRQFLLAIMAGLFIGLAGNGASITAYSVPAAGMSKMLSGVLFGTGLILVLMAGAEYGYIRVIADEGEAIFVIWKHTDWKAWMKKTVIPEGMKDYFTALEKALKSMAEYYPDYLKKGNQEQRLSKCEDQVMNFCASHTMDFTSCRDEGIFVYYRIPGGIRYGNVSGSVVFEERGVFCNLLWSKCQ